MGFSHLVFRPYVYQDSSPPCRRLARDASSASVMTELETSIWKTSLSSLSAWSLSSGTKLDKVQPIGLMVNWEITIVSVGEEMMCKYKEPETVFAINSLPMPVSSDKRSIET